ncbi:hypothetical protein VKT23_008463 [Stygiomarasmius scandens]|uniref:PSP1 C-terminal domain-containing protein n=1 Tax=Marasmiellus scandens TaxID=2682957 RepID=A0ABR1JGH3_9AGAR
MLYAHTYAYAYHPHPHSHPHQYIRRPTQQDQSNMSPFHRDVGQILLDDPSSHSQLRDLLVRGDREREDVLGGGKYGHIGGGGGQGYAGIYGGPAAGVGRAGGGGGYGGLGGLGGVSSGRGGGGGEYMADGGGSGAGSRRHSLSVIQPGKRGSFVGSFGAGGGGGSALEDEFDDGQGHGQRIPIGGAGNIRRPSASYIGSGGGSGAGAGGGGGGSGLMLSDEDLVGAGDLNMNFGMMSLRDQISHPHAGSPGGRGGLAVPGSGGAGGMTSQPSSLPIYAPMSRSPLGGGAGAIGSTLGLSIPGHGIGGHQDAREGTSSRASRGSASEHSQSQGTGSGQGSSPGPVQPGLPPLQVQGQQQPQAPQGQGQVQNQGLNGTYASRARAGSNAGMPSSPLSPMSPTRGMIGFGMGGAMGGLMSPTHVHPQQQQFHGHQQQQQPQQQHPQHGFYAPQQQPQHLIGRRASNASLHGAPTGPDGGAAATQGGNEHGLGRGLPLSAVPPSWQLYIVEFKAGRTDLFYMTDALRLELLRAEQGGQQNGHGGNPVKVGDYVIVEADRGRDLGRVVNDSITIEEVERWLEGRAAAAAANPHSGAPVSAGPESAGGGGAWGDTPMSPTMSSHSGPHGSSHKKEINPKQIYAKAGPNEAALLSVKTADEVKALQLCQSKVRAKKLPMEVVDAEYQWDRRKLTFYFVAEKRIDFRELVRELFRLYKTRIWMASLQGAGGFEQ